MTARLFGTYVGSNVSWKCITNQPTKGYASFAFYDNHGDVYIPGASTLPFYSRQWNVSGSWATNSGQNYLPNAFILVYNVEAYKQYLDTLSEDDFYWLLYNYAFLLAECNIKKEKHQTTGVTDWSDNDDYHGE